MPLIPIFSDWKFAIGNLQSAICSHLLSVCPGKVLQTRWMKGFIHTNYPFQVCSLTTGSSSSWLSVCRSVVTKSREGKAGCIQHGTWSGSSRETVGISGYGKSEGSTRWWTRRQSERQGKLTGCRQTNYCKHRKGETPELLSEVLILSESSVCSMCEDRRILRSKWISASISLTV